MQAAGLNQMSGYHTYDRSMAAAFRTIVQQEGVGAINPHPYHASYHRNLSYVGSHSGISQCQPPVSVATTPWTQAKNGHFWAQNLLSLWSCRKVRLEVLEVILALVEHQIVLEVLRPPRAAF